MKPTAAPAYFPYAHRTMAELMQSAVNERAADTASWVNAMSRACPRCEASPGKQCVGGNGRLYGGIHTARRAG
jgi:hypothetical protein